MHFDKATAINQGAPWFRYAPESQEGLDRQPDEDVRDELLRKIGHLYKGLDEVGKLGTKGRNPVPELMSTTTTQAEGFGKVFQFNY